MPKRRYFKFATGAVTASYAYIDQPDTGGQYSDNKYKLTVILDADHDDVVKIGELCELAAADEWGDNRPANLHLPTFHPKDETGTPDESRIAFRLKSKQQPVRTDSKGQPLPPDVQIRSGDIVRVAGAVSAYVSGPNAGVTLYLNQVRLIEKRVDDPFGGADDGFVAPAAAPAAVLDEIDDGLAADINF